MDSIVRKLFGGPPQPPVPPLEAASSSLTVEEDTGVLASEHAMNTHPLLLEALVAYLDLRTVSRLREVSSGFRETLDNGHGPRNLSLTRQSLSNEASHGSKIVFTRWGPHLSQLFLLRCPTSGPQALPSILLLTPRLRKLHLTDPEPISWDMALMARAILSLTSLEELRLHSNDVLGYDISPFTALILALGEVPMEVGGEGGASASPSSMEAMGGGDGGGGGGGGGGGVHNSGVSSNANPVSTPPTPLSQPQAHAPSRPLPRLRKLSIFTRLTADTSSALARYIGHHARLSRNLVKLKLSTGLISSPGGGEILSALGHHPSLRKLTLMRPEGMGEPMRKSHCQLLAQAMVISRSLASIHIRRAGLWTDALISLTPSHPCPHITCLKLDSNSLAYLSSTFFSEAMDALLSKLPRLKSLHLGNNQIDGIQTIALAASLVKHKINHLTSLTLGSNDLGDLGLASILAFLPPSLEQLYLHGTQISDVGAFHVRDALLRLPSLWGVGLNGNALSDVGVATLCQGLAGRKNLQDIGVTLSDMTDHGCQLLGEALSTCPSLRFVYLYSSGFKAATKVTDLGKEAIKKQLPPFCTPALDHRLSRYLKQKS